jgi:hypothetical protein
MKDGAKSIWTTFLSLPALNRPIKGETKERKKRRLEKEKTAYLDT